MRILSLSTVYPNPAEPGLGLFVQSRLRAMAEKVDLRVVAPVPLVDYGRGVPKLRATPALLTSPAQKCQVYYPNRLYPPGGTPLNPLLLYTRLLPLLGRIHHHFPFDIIDSHFC